MMGAITDTNAALKSLAEVTGYPVDELIPIEPNDYTSDAMIKITKNLAACIESFNKHLEEVLDD